MIGLASMMRSPSTLSIRRSTPCVDGCCGPKLSSISWTSKSVWAPGATSVVSPVALDAAAGAEALAAATRSARYAASSFSAWEILSSVMRSSQETTLRLGSSFGGPPPSGHSSG